MSLLQILKKERSKFNIRSILYLHFQVVYLTSLFETRYTDDPLYHISVIHYHENLVERLIVPEEWCPSGVCCLSLPSVWLNCYSGQGCVCLVLGEGLSRSSL